MEATFARPDDEYQLVAAATIDAGQVVQLPTGEAAWLYPDTPSGPGVSSGATTNRLRTRGKATVEKQTGVVLLPGQRVYWDHSANKATYRKVNDRDFYLGLCAEDASSGALVVAVDLNKEPKYLVDALRDGSKTVIVGTQGLNTMGVFDRGGSKSMVLSATSEAQKLDILSVDGFAVAANAIVECVFRVPDNSAGSNPDFNVGVASGTDATDFESVAEFAVAHLDGNTLDLDVMSDDGTTDVAEDDTDANVVEGSDVANRVHVLIDLRNPADVQFVVDGALVNDGTTFRLDNATGPLFLIAHLEKTSSADTFEAVIDALRCWTSEQ